MDIKSRLADTFACDLRSLAAFRMAVALTFFVDMFWRIKDLTAHYADDGLLPRDALLAKFSNIWHVSLLFMNGQTAFAALVLGAAMVFAVMLFLGVYTRLATAVCWLALVSFHGRNPLVLHGGDMLLRMLFFWALFLPLGARWSLDKRRCARDAAKSGKTPVVATGRFTSPGSLAIMLQVVLIYFFTVLHKSGREWWPDGTAVYYALHLDNFATPLAVWFRQFPDLMRWSTYATLLAEMVLPLLFFVPFATAYFRMAAVIGLSLMHLSFGQFLELGNFPWVDICSFIIFIPTAAWDYLERKLAHQKVVVGGAVAKTGERCFEWILARMTMVPDLGLNPWRSTQLLVGLLAVYVVAWNAGGIKSWGVKMAPALRAVGHLLRLDQEWGMFAPFPMKDGGWFVVDGRLRSGSPVDVLAQKEGPASFEKPADVRLSYIDSRWRKYYMNIWSAAHKGHRLYLGKYLCRQWNRQHTGNDQLQDFTIYYMREDTLPDYQPRSVQKVSLWRHDCFG